METSIKLPKGFKSVHMPSISEQYFAVYHNEIGFGGGIDSIWVAGYNEATKKARPTHGYFAPHKTGQKLRKHFKRIGFEWIQ